MVWNAHKAVIGGIIMKLSSICKKKQQIDSLTSQIANVETQHKTNPHPALLAQLLTLRQELRSLLLSSYEQMQRKIKATSYSTSNKAGKKLAQHLKGVKLKFKIPHLFHPHSKKKLSNPQDIANAFSDYYSDLYNLRKDTFTHQPSTEEIDEFLNQIKLLTETQLSSLNVPFSEQEILATIPSLPSRKAPGPHGLMGEYFKQFSNHLLPQLTKLFNNAASSSMFAKESLAALIITLTKPGKEPTSPQNFHPISLLNLDLKIYAITIARRLMIIMPDLIHKD